MFLFLVFGAALKKKERKNQIKTINTAVLSRKSSVSLAETLV